MKIIILKKSLNPLKTLRIPVPHLPSVIILTYYDMIILRNSYPYDLFILDNLEIIAILEALAVLEIIDIPNTLTVLVNPDNPENPDVSERLEFNHYTECWFTERRKLSFSRRSRNYSFPRHSSDSSHSRLDR